MELKSPCKYCRAAHLAREGDYVSALELLNDVLELSPDYCPARMLRGRLLALTGEVSRAINEFRIVLACEPANRDAHLSLGSLYALHNMLGDAEQHLRFAGYSTGQSWAPVTPQCVYSRN